MERAGSCGSKITDAVCPVQGEICCRTAAAFWAELGRGCCSARRTAPSWAGSWNLHPAFTRERRRSFVFPARKHLGKAALSGWQSRRRRCWNNAGIRWPKECGRSFCCWRNRIGNFYDHTRTHRTGGGACPRRLFCCFETEILLSVKNLCIKTPLMMVGERKINKMFIYPRGKTCFFRVK